MKYPLHKELRMLNFRPPNFPKFLYAPIQKAMRGYFQFLLNRKDEKFIIQRHNIKEGLALFEVCPKDLQTQRAIYWIHGGGFVFPHAPHHLAQAKLYAEKLQAKVFLIDYNLAPKHKDPKAVEDCIAGYTYLLENSQALGIDSNFLLLGGDSAGGYLAIKSLLAVQKTYSHKPKGLVLVYPVVSTSMDFPSMQNFVDVPLCNTKYSRHLLDCYSYGKDISVLDEDLSTLPQSYVEVCEFDSLRDAAQEIVEKLQSLGLPSTMLEVRNAMHGYDFLTKSNYVQKHLEKRIAFMKTFLVDK